MEIKVMEKVLVENENRAGELRSLLQEKKILMVNLISSPGSGKTSILEKTLPILKNRYNIAIIEGDVESDKDAQRLNKFNIPIVLINTKGSCHLDSESINNALSEFNLDEIDLIFIENVGNMVCPAEFDLGEDNKIAVISTAEGDDKPIKYPLLFRESTLCILNKIDLLPYINFKKETFYRDIKKLNSNLPVFEISCTTNNGFQNWLDWLENKISQKKQIN